MVQHIGTVFQDFAQSSGGALLGVVLLVSAFLLLKRWVSGLLNPVVMMGKEHGRYAGMKARKDMADKFAKAHQRAEDRREERRRFGSPR